MAPKAKAKAKGKSGSQARPVFGSTIWVLSCPCSLGPPQFDCGCVGEFFPKSECANGVLFICATCGKESVTFTGQPEDFATAA